MAWDVLQQPFQYHPPVAPEVPVADKTAAKIISAGTDAGVSAFTRMAIAREQARLEQEKQMQDADIAAQGLQVKREQMKQDYDLKSMLYGSYQQNAEANKIRAQTAFKNIIDRNKEAADAQEQLDKLNSDFSARAHELGVDDPNAQTKDTVGFAANLQKLTDEFGNAPAYTGIPDRLKSWQRIADQQTIHLPLGAHYDSKTQQWKGIDSSAPVPVWQVVKGLQDPTTASTWKNILIASGHIKVDEKQQPLPDNRNPWQKIAPSILGGKPAETKTVTMETPDELATNLESQSKQVDFSRSQSRIPLAVPKLTRPQAEKFGTGLDQGSIDDAVNAVGNEAPLPAPDLPPESSATPASSATRPLVQPTETDKMVAMARAAIGRGAPLPAVAGKLRELNIDPNLLFG